jgi:hypothetical protein
MRPVNKRAVGDNNGENTILATYNPHGNAYELLRDNIGLFCSYCEVFSSDLEVEHIVSQMQATKESRPGLNTDWNNFLLSCGRCNGADNKGNMPVNLDTIYIPHLHNTSYVLNYSEGGYVSINPDLTDQEKLRALALLDLVCIDKYPDNPRYVARSMLPRDERWNLRREAWETANRILVKHAAGEYDASSVAEFAHWRGFFSVWFSVFKDCPLVRQALIDKFIGTSKECFDADNGYEPVPSPNR